MIIIITTNGQIETASGVTKIEEMQEREGRSTRLNEVQLYAGEEMVGSVQTNQSSLEVLPE